MDLAGHTAFVTGSSRNLGRAVALAFAANGANVVAHGLANREGAEETAQLAREGGVDAIAVMGDVGDQDAVRRMAAEATARFGVVDILVNCAAVRPRVHTLELSAEDWRRVVATNLDGAFFCAQAVLPGMIAQRWGRIVNMAGGAAFVGQPGEPHVSASKAGILGLTRSLAKEFAKDNVLVNAISPGILHTGDSPYRSGGRDYEKLAAHFPLGRNIEPEEVAELCLYLCSPAQISMTGQTLHLNGGTWLG